MPCLVEQLSSHLPRARYFIIYADSLFLKARVGMHLDSQGTGCSCSPWHPQQVFFAVTFAAERSLGEGHPLSLVTTPLPTKQWEQLQHSRRCGRFSFG